MSNYVKKIVSDYCVLDTETTGLSAYYDEVIEIGILKVRSGDVTDRYEQLIRPKYEIDGFITSLTGITNEMVADKPPIEDVKGDVLAFWKTTSSSVITRPLMSGSSPRDSKRTSITSTWIRCSLPENCIMIASSPAFRFVRVSESDEQ